MLLCKQHNGVESQLLQALHQDTRAGNGAEVFHFLGSGNNGGSFPESGDCGDVEVFTGESAEEE